MIQFQWLNWELMKRKLNKWWNWFVRWLFSPYWQHLSSGLSIKFCTSFFFFFLILFYLALQYCIVLPYIKMNLPQVYMCSPSWTLLPPPSPYHPSRSSQCTSPSIQYRASNLDWRLVSYMIYIFQCHSPKSSHPCPLPQGPKDCSIHLCLFCCLAYRVIVTIFLNSIYMR